MMLLRWRNTACSLLFLCAAVAAGSDVAICNSHKATSSQDASTAVPMYTNYIRHLYHSGFSRKRIDLPSTCDDLFYLYDAASGIPDETAVWLEYKECDAIRTNIANVAQGKDLTFPWPSTLPRSYPSPATPPEHTVKLRYQGTAYPHDFVVQRAKTTVWTLVHLVEEEQFSFSHLYQLPPDLFKEPVRFSAKGFAGLEDYLVFKSPVLAKLTQAQLPQQQGTVWGIATTGCRPPIFTLTTNWRNRAVCSSPEIFVTQVTEESSFACTMQFVSGDPTLNQETLTQLPYAVAPLLGRIALSLSHAQAVLDCLSLSSPTAQLQFSFWGQWTPTTPGACSPCAPRRLARSGATPVPRMCNRTQGELGDCCFACQPGYNSLYHRATADGVPQQHCVAACPPGTVYDDATAFLPRCVTCPPGKYSHPDGRVCQTCETLGVPNAYAGRRGCVECGSRALAVAAATSSDCLDCYTTCRACSVQHYVPANTRACVPCPEGSVLRTAQATSCTPCPAGFYASDGRCLQCPTDTFKSREGAGECLPCATGHQSVPNRTLCVPCTNLNRTLTPFAIYQGPGCIAVCNRSASYPQGTNPYVPNGCVSCARLVVPNGMNASRDDCARFLPCINVPSPNSTGLLRYTGPGDRQGICPWQCALGWYLQGATCFACAHAQQGAFRFNASLHVYTDPFCGFACIPGLFYRGPTGAASCTQMCVRLDDVLHPRVSDYWIWSPTKNGSRVSLRALPPLNYRTGVCGSNATDSTSALGVVRHRGIYGFASALFASQCGDHMLSEGEECDDGNTASGDGCSATCKVERTGYWDCDVLGEPCLPNCGWPDLQGFALPPPPGTVLSPWCTGITYARDFLKTPMVARGLWLQTHLVPCQCARNPHQTLPYSECNYTNRGCRQCPPGHFQDDLYARCARCGGACALGFWAFNRSRGDGTNVAVMAKYGLTNLDLCGPDIATSQDLSFADPILDPIAFGMDQLKLGCAPCSAGIYNSPSQVVFTTSDCQWKCRRDYSNVSEPKYYCEGPLQPHHDGSNTDHYCNQRCLDCAQSLRSLRTPTTWGWYVQSCADGVGHVYARCANLTDPNALFLGNSLLVGDSTGCPWACRSGYQLLRGACVPCHQTKCAEGEVLQQCDAGASFYCAPCALVQPAGALQPLQVWFSVPPAYRECVPGCEPGFAYQSAPNETCRPCSYVECALDQQLVPCTQTTNAYCAPCPPLLQHHEFFWAGTCKTRCAQGFAGSPNCASCRLSVTCPAGQRRSSDCLLPDERLRLPTCIPCAPIDTPLNRPTPGRMWAQAEGTCNTTCAAQWMFQAQQNASMHAHNLTCVPCNVTLCAYGQQGVCVFGQLRCESCGAAFALLDVRRQFRSPGDCTVVCAPGFEEPDCRPTIASAVPAPPLANGNSSSGLAPVIVVMGVSLEELQKRTLNATTLANNTTAFPIRTLPHS